MNHLTKEYVTKLKDSLLFINAVVIIYNASLFLLSTKYISVHYYARDFLNKVSYITRTPQNIFFESIFLFIILVLLMKLREKDNLKMANGLVYIEIILSFLLIIRLNGSYNGILLFVFADLLYNMRNIKHMALLLLMAFGLLLISDYNILSNIIHMPSIESYLSFYPNSSRTFMLFAKNILASLNVVVFILYLICQVLVQQEETKKISKELQLASKVNDELKTYSALSEKMAEDKERKRISREIHDTLGHALTGISAGIDACIALIDIDPQKSKEQLLVISNVVRESIKDVRRSLYKLRPGALDQRTLKDGLIKMIEEFQSVSHLNVDLYYEWENYLFVHAGVDLTKKDWRKTSPRDFIWIREPFHEGKNNTGKTIVFGHTITPMLHGDMQTTDLWIQDHKIGMDGGAVFGGSLHGVVFDKESILQDIEYQNNEGSWQGI